jgi:hypothetical protein
MRTNLRGHPWPSTATTATAQVAATNPAASAGHPPTTPLLPGQLPRGPTRTRRASAAPMGMGNPGPHRVPANLPPRTVNMGRVPNPMESLLPLVCLGIHLVCQASQGQEVLLDPPVLVALTDCPWAIPIKMEYRQVFPVLSHPGHHW